MKIKSVDGAKMVVPENAQIAATPTVLNALRGVQENTGVLKRLAEGGVPQAVAQNHCHTNDHWNRERGQEGSSHENIHTNTWRHCKNDKDENVGKKDSVA